MFYSAQNARFYIKAIIISSISYVLTYFYVFILWGMSQQWYIIKIIKNIKRIGFAPNAKNILIRLVRTVVLLNIIWKKTKVPLMHSTTRANNLNTSWE